MFIPDHLQGSRPEQKPPGSTLGSSTKTDATATETDAERRSKNHIGKDIEAGADIAENLGNAVGGLFQVGPAYDQDEEAFVREMNRRKKRKRGRSL